MKELNKTIQDQKMEVETIKKSQSESSLELESLGKEFKSHRFKHQQQNTRDRTKISDVEDTIEN